MQHEIRFKEIQYTGRNIYGLSRRLVMAIFLIVAHFYSTADENLEGALLILGLLLILGSVILWFIPNYHILLTNQVLVLKPSYGKEIRLPLEYIEKATVVRYSKYHFNNIVFNVLDEDEYKYYAEGSKALLLNLKAGNTFRIGCKRADELQLKIEEIKKLS